MIDKRVIVTGSRDFTDREMVRRGLMGVGPCIVVHGGCRGADHLAEAVAHELGWPSERHVADWATHGRSAGPRRNQAMVDAGADELLAFSSMDYELTTGTQDCWDRAQTAGIECSAYFRSGRYYSVSGDGYSSTVLNPLT